MRLALIQQGTTSSTTYVGNIHGWNIELAYHYGRLTWIVDLYFCSTWTGYQNGTREELLDFIVDQLNKKGVPITYVELLNETDLAIEEILLN